MLYERGERKTYEAVVSLTDRRASSPVTHIEGVQAPIMVEEFMACEEVVQADPRWQEAMRKRGVEDFSLAMIDPWASGYTGPEDDPADAADLRPLTWVRSEPGDHGYARPVEGLVVDRRPRRDGGRRGRRPRRRPDPAEARQLRRGRGSRDPDNVPALRGVARRPQADRDHPARGPELHRRRPRGAAGRSGTLRIGFTPREGLVLHQVGYEDRGRCGRSSTAPRWPRCTSPTATRRRRTASRTSSTWASTASAGWPTR